MLNIKASTDCQYDILSLGEVMIRFDPGNQRIRNTRNFQIWEGGGEYNVARGLRRCFDQRAAVVTGIVKNEIGFLLEDLILQGGVDSSLVKWFDFDGIGRSVRNSLNFVERGYGVRGTVGCSDRGHTATTHLKPGEIDWDHIFGTLGVRWFHTGGIFAALSDDTYAVAVEAMQAAKKHGTIVSFDLNYRSSLWQDRGGLQQCIQVNQSLAPLVDVMIGFPALLGIDAAAHSKNANQLTAEEFEQVLSATAKQFPNLHVCSTTVRHEISSSEIGWSGVAWGNHCFYQSNGVKNVAVFDRIGGGDGFASGLIYGLMEKQDLQIALEYGNAHGALVMTTPGDNSMVSLDEVEAVMTGKLGKTQR